jgi:general secretion pathway protein D
LNLKFFVRISEWLGYLSITVLLVACAGSQAYREGNALLADGKIEPGLAKLGEAVKLDPKNAEYRIAYVNRKLNIIYRLNTYGDSARQQGSLTEAEKAYKQVLAIDSNNPIAKQGLDAVVKDRRHKEALEEVDALFKKGGPNNIADALDKLRPVLNENPNQREALNLKARIDEHQAKQKPAEAKLAAAYRKPITLEFKDAPLRSVFDVIAKVSGLNFYFDKDVRPDLKVTVFSKQTSIEDAIRLLLVTSQLEQTVLNENSVLIYPSTPQKLKDYQQLSVRTFFLANADVKAVSNTIKTILKTKDMVIDERLGLVIIRDTPDAIRMAERIIALQDLNDPEVMLEVEILEVKRSRLLELGVRWPEQIGFSLSPLTTSPTTGAAGSLSLADLLGANRDSIKVTLGGATINARKEDSDSNILANPRIRVRNKEKAKILIGDRVPVITTTSTSTGFVSDSVSYVDVGLKLDVEPNIYLDEEVAIKISLEVSNLVREVISKSGTLSYQIGTRNASTVLRLKDGETQVLAGLISDEDRSTANKVPGIGELPVLSRLFGSQKDDTQRSEIVLSITPRVLRSIRRPDLMAAEFTSGTESNIGSRGLLLGAVEVEAKPAEVKTAASQNASPGSQPVRQLPANPTNIGANNKNGSSAADTPVQPSQPRISGDATSTTGNGANGIQPQGIIGDAISLNWQGPGQVKVGDQFSAVLRINSQGTVRGLPLLIGFDPVVLQVVSVQEGDFLKQANGQTSFNNRIDPTQGKIFVAAVRQNTSGTDKGINGTGSVMMVNFKAIKAASASKVQLLSITPEPAASNPIKIPVDFALKVQ